MGEMITRELSQLFFGCASLRFEDNKGLGCFTPVLMRNPHDGYLLNGRMSKQYSFDLY